MRYISAVAIALRALRLNLLRSALTMLGIIIGVGAVIAMVAVGSGAQMEVTERIRHLGANLLVVIPSSQSSGGIRLGAGTGHTLVDADATAIDQEIALVEFAIPKVHGRARAVYGNSNWMTSVSGVTQAFFPALNWKIISGWHFTDEEETFASKVALVGQTVAKNLFKDDMPLGRTIRIKNVPFVIIGVLSSKGLSSGGSDMDDNIYVPLSTARLRLFGGKHMASPRSLDSIIVKVVNTGAMEEAAAQVHELLRQRHRLGQNVPNDFAIVDISTVQAAHKSASRTMGYLLFAVASVSLVVGGISIMNIMLVSVTERTREIGLRLALGARRRDIRNQFLIEALTLSWLGGLVGIVVGVAVAAAMAKLGDWPVVIGLETLGFAFVFASAVGICFGFYPARRASRLDPIEALRFE